MTDNRIELSRGVGTAPGYGKSMRSVGADQAKTVVVATAHKASLARIAGSHGSRTMIRRLAWARRTTVRWAVAQEAPRRATRRCRFNDHRLGGIVMVVELGRPASQSGARVRG